MDNDLVTLSSSMKTYFDLRELKSLAFELGVDSENLDRTSKASFVEELIKYFGRRDQIPKLLSFLQQQRPNVVWPIIDQITFDQAQDMPSKADVINNYYGNVVQGNNNRTGGDDFSIVGGISNSTVSLKSTLSSMQTSLQPSSTTAQTGQDDLVNLAKELTKILSDIPEPHSEEIREGREIVLETLETLIKEVQTEKPRRLRIKLNGDNLRSAAKSFATVSPTVMDVVERIVNKAHQLIDS